MIQQSSANPAGIVIDLKPATTPPDDPEGQWHGFDVLRLLGRELVRSINPFYFPDNSLPTVTGVAAGIDSPTLDNQTSHCPGFTTLAARTIAAWANLPPEIDQALGYLANLVAAGQAASDQFEALTASAGMLPKPGTDRENVPDETVENAKKKTGKAPQYQRRQPNKTTTAMLQASLLPDTSLALGALVGLSAMGASSASDWLGGWQLINTTDELKKICTDETRYPCEGKYWLTRGITIDASQWKPIGSGQRSFRGELNSGDRTIRNLSDCLIKNLAGNGKIQNLRFTNANIELNKKAAGVVVCKMSGNASVSNIHVGHANLVSHRKGANAGIVVGIVNAGTVFNIIARNCTVTATGTGTNAGIGAGLIKKGGTINTTMAVNCKVSTRGENAAAGIGAGENKGIVRNTLAYKCHLSTRGKSADAGIGAGDNRGTVGYTTANKCTVLTYSDFSDAGIGAGENRGTVRYTTAYKCAVLTDGYASAAGIGAGQSLRDASSNWTVISDTAAFGCNVSTTDIRAYAGIGAGYIEYQGSIDKTTAVKCTVTTSGLESDVGIGAGLRQEKTGPGNKGAINNTRVIESTVKSEKEDSKAAINGGHKPTVCNTTIINGKKAKYEETVNCHIDSNTACEGFDPRLVRKNCQIVPGGLFGTNAPPTYPTTEPLTTVPTWNISSLDPHVTTTPPTIPVRSTNTTSPGQGSATRATPPITTAPLSSSKMPLSSPGSATSATPPITPAPLSSSKMPLSSPGSATSATPPITPAPLTSSNLPLSSPGFATITTPPTNAPKVTVMTAYSSVSTQFATPPLTKSLSPAFFAIIATLGAAFVVLFAVIGVRTYLNYCRRSSANAGHNQPMPEQPERRPRGERPLPSMLQIEYQLLPISPVNKSTLPTAPQSHYQPLTGCRENTSALPGSLQSHYQPLSDNRGNGRTLPQSHHYQPLTGRQGNTAAGGGNPLVGNPAPTTYDYLEPHVYYEIGNSVANGQARTATAASTTPMASTGNEPPPGQQNPVHPVMTEPETDSDHSYDEPAVVTPAGMATGDSSHGERW